MATCQGLSQNLVSVQPFINSQVTRVLILQNPPVFDIVMIKFFLEEIMLRLLLVCVLLVCVLLSVGVSALAVEPDEVSRTRNIFFVDGVRTPLRTINVAGQDFVNIFDMAVALSDTNSRFSPRWNVRNHSLNIDSGQAFPFIGTNFSFLTPTVNDAFFADVGVLYNNRLVNLAAYRIDSSVYFSLNQVAAMLDIGILNSEEENVVHLVTDMTFTESLYAKRAINPFQPMIALTFDDGPSTYTIPILDALEQHGVVATFYVTANRLNNHMDIATRTHIMGNEIANHSWSHPRLTDLSREGIHAELHNSNVAIAAITGTAPASLRPPFGAYDYRVSEIARDLGLPLVLWSLDTWDWRTRDADATFDAVMNNVRDRDIILMHDIHEPTARAAVRLIPALIEQGFQLVTVSELFYFSDITPVPGATYNFGYGRREWRRGG